MPFYYQSSYRSRIQIASELYLLICRISIEYVHHLTFGMLKVPAIVQKYEGWVVRDTVLSFKIPGLFEHSFVSPISDICSTYKYLLNFNPGGFHYHCTKTPK